MSIRLDKFLTISAGCSRKEAKRLIVKGQISVNGDVVKKPETKIDENQAAVFLRGEKLGYEEHVYYMLNKPPGVISATTDTKDTTVTDLIREESRDIFPVGRLDKDTEGLVILTDDGKLTHQLLSPKKHVEKEYYVEVDSTLTEEDVLHFKEGIDIGEKNITMPAKLDIISEYSANVIICEGKFHQIKRMFKKNGKKVTYLKRLRMGAIVLDRELKSGEYRKLKENETELLRTYYKNE